jgi:hypothetical protein
LMGTASRAALSLSAATSAWRRVSAVCMCYSRV